MIFTATQSLDELRSEVEAAMRSATDLAFDDTEYIDNDELSARGLRDYKQSWARYLLSKADSDGKLNAINSHIDPIAFRASAEKKISTGFLTSHRHYVTFQVFNLRRLEQLLDGVDPEPRMQSYDVEILADFCDPNHEQAMSYYWDVMERFRPR